MRFGAIVGSVVAFLFFIMLTVWGEGDKSALMSLLMFATFLICISNIEK